MLFSYNWLKEYLQDIPQAHELARALTMSGTEIESVTPVGSTLENVVTAEVVTCDKHPNADRLSLCTVRTDSESYSIVCGASNMKPGDRVVLALSGAELPGGIKIKRSKIRGVESQGMMCSEVELGLKDTSEGIMILAKDTPLGADINAVLGLGDFMMEAGITPNRADLLSVRGLAREISAVTGARFAEKAAVFSVPESDKDVGELATVSIEADAPCSRYLGRVIEGVKVGPSPEPLRKRLESHGIRSVNNVVDATNLILLETGQPLHAFDLDTIEGAALDVRFAGPDESMETLDGKSRVLGTDILVIADARGPVAVAGVMGGGRTEVRDSTSRILLEGAHFDPSAVRRASKRLGLSTDSSYRFERGVDPCSTALAINGAAALITAVAGGKIARGLLEIGAGAPAREPISFRTKRASDLLGIELTVEESSSIFARLGISVKVEGEGVILATPPSYRNDLKEEVDLLEETARLYGYERMPTTFARTEMSPSNPGRHTSVKKVVREVLVNAGFFEVVNYSFVSSRLFAMASCNADAGIRVKNPITEDQVLMRASLLPSLLENLKANLLKKNEEVNIFEIAPVFLPGGRLPKETWSLSLLMHSGRYAKAWNSPVEWVDFYDVKGVAEKLLGGLGIKDVEFRPASHRLMHPGKSADMIVGGRVAGSIGALHPDLFSDYGLKRETLLLEADIDLFAGSFGLGGSYRPLPRFPESSRDIAFIVDEKYLYGEIISLIGRLDEKLIERVELFDVYCGNNIPAGKRSLAIRIVYRSSERTLTSEEVDAIHNRAIEALVAGFDAQVRGPAQ